VNILTKSEVGKMAKAESMAYIAALTTEVDRLQRRSRAHRQNIRSMSAKLELANLKTEVDCYTKMSRNPLVTNIDTLNRAIRAVDEHALAIEVG